MGKYLVAMLLLCMMLAAVSTVHAENASSGYKNATSKSILRAVVTIPGFDAWGQTPGWLPAMNGSHPKPINGSLQPQDIPTSTTVPGVRHRFSREIVILGSRDRR